MPREVKTFVAPSNWADALIHDDWSRWDYLGDNVEAERVEEFKDGLPGPVLRAFGLGELRPYDTNTPDEPRQEFTEFWVVDTRSPLGADVARLMLFGSRMDCISMLQGLDPNGVYSDEDSEAEGMHPIGITEAQDLILQKFAEA